MTFKRLSSGSHFEEEIAYSRAIVDGDYVFVSGTTGYDYTTMNISDDIVEQTEQCFKTIAATLGEAGSSIQNIVRITYILPKREQFSLCWPVIRQWLASVKPAATMFEANLIDEAMKIEIQVTARVVNGG